VTDGVSKALQQGVETPAGNPKPLKRVPKARFTGRRFPSPGMNVGATDERRIKRWILITYNIS
jgi:hypothetical protein